MTLSGMYRNGYSVYGKDIYDIISFTKLNEKVIYKNGRHLCDADDLIALFESLDLEVCEFSTPAKLIPADLSVLEGNVL